LCPVTVVNKLNYWSIFQTRGRYYLQRRTETTER